MSVTLLLFLVMLANSTHEYSTIFALLVFLLFVILYTKRRRLRGTFGLETHLARFNLAFEKDLLKFSSRVSRGFVKGYDEFKAEL